MSTMSSWIRPACRSKEIESLVSGVDRYNPSNVGILEDYLYDQTRKNEYDCLANLAILKLYQFNPTLYNPDVVINILIKALTALPLPDYNLCIGLLEVPANSNLDEPDPLPSVLVHLNKLHFALRQCRFPAFWSLYKSDELASLRDNYTVECAGFEDSIREVVIRAVRATFKKIGRDRLASYLDLQGGEFDQYVADLGWSVEKSTGAVTVPPNPDNTVEATVVRENIQLSQLSKIISHTARDL